MSSADNVVVPITSSPSILHATLAPQLSAAAGLQAEAVQGLDAVYPGTLTQEMRALIQKTGGLSAADFGAIDFTGRWHPQEPIDVLRPSLTLAIDDEGRRWIGETSRDRGLPGPIWCVFQDPAVALYVCEDLGAFLGKLSKFAAKGGPAGQWLRRLEQRARGVWAARETLARNSYEVCSQDPALRDWLALLPVDTRIYDLRDPSTPRGWPYGLAGPDGRLYRCGLLPIFAVARTPSTTRWSRHMAHIAATREMLWPAVVSQLAA